MVTPAELANLAELVALMRTSGVKRLRTESGLELELSALPEPPPPAPTPETLEQREVRVRRELIDELSIRYMHTGGFRGSEADLDKLVSERMRAQ